MCWSAHGGWSPHGLGRAPPTPQRSSGPCAGALRCYAMAGPRLSPGNGHTHSSHAAQQPADGPPLTRACANTHTTGIPKRTYGWAGGNHNAQGMPPPAALRSLQRPTRSDVSDYTRPDTSSVSGSLFSSLWRYVSLHAPSSPSSMHSAPPTHAALGASSDRHPPCGRSHAGARHRSSVFAAPNRPGRDVGL